MIIAMIEYTIKNIYLRFNKKSYHNVIKHANLRWSGYFHNLAISNDLTTMYYEPWCKFEPEIINTKNIIKHVVLETRPEPPSREIPRRYIHKRKPIILRFYFVDEIMEIKKSENFNYLLDVLELIYKQNHKKIHIRPYPGARKH